MKVLTATMVEVEGGRPQLVSLAQPAARNGFYRDLKVLAFPAGQEIPAPAIAASFPLTAGNSLTDGNAATKELLPVHMAGGQCFVTLTYPRSVWARALSLTFDEGHLFLKASLECSDDGVVFRTVRSLDVRQPHYPRTPKIFSLGATPVTAKIWRLKFENANPPAWYPPHPLTLSEVGLSNCAMIESVEKMNAGSDHYGLILPSAEQSAAQGIAMDAVVDLTARLSTKGEVQWDVPPGRWRILRFGYTVTGRTNSPATLSGLECDKLSRQGLDAHFPAMVGRLLEENRSEGAFNFSLIDSYEVGGQNWTEGFEQEFARRRGYALDRWYPALFGYVVGNARDSSRFLFDFQQTVAELFAENYYDYFAELCHKNSLRAVIEPYGGPFENFRCGKNADMPAGEFWVKGTLSKLAGSLGHIYGKRYIGAEAFTSDNTRGHGKEDPSLLMQSAENAFLQGVNLLMLHSFVHQPLNNAKPGLTLGKYGSMLNRNNTWWAQGGQFVAELNRMQFLLQQGTPVADVLLLVDEGSPNDLPNDGGLRQNGYDYDFCNTDVLFNRVLVATDGSLLLPEGTRYPLLFLAEAPCRSVAVLKRLKALIEAGATVAGIAPTGSPTLSDGDERTGEWLALVDWLWGDAKPGAVRSLGKGRLIVTASAREALKRAGILPDLKQSTGILTVHRRIGDADLYFLKNTAQQSTDGEIGFRGLSERIAERLSVTDGKRTPVAMYRHADAYLMVNLSLRAQESAFLLFTPRAEGDVPIAVRGTVGIPVLERAVYRGVGEDGGNDVTGIVRQLLEREATGFRVNNPTLGGDPAPMRAKELVLSCRGEENQHRVLTVKEHEQVTLAGLGVEGRLPHLEGRKDGRRVLCFEAPGMAEVRFASGKERRLAVAQMPQAVDLAADWTVTFPLPGNEPKVVLFARQESWTAHPDPDIRFFSGTAIATREFVLPAGSLKAGRAWVLDLGEVCNLVNVTVNGRQAGTLYRSPFRMEITQSLKEGENRIELALTNLSANRRIGDLQIVNPDRMEGALPAWVIAGRAVSENGRSTWCEWGGWKAEDSLLPSGLLGPTRLYPVEQLPVTVP